MISSAWEISGEIGRLSRVVHPWSSRERMFAMLELRAFSDESHTDHEVYCVAGYWGTARAWESFDKLWNAELALRGLREFHAEECEQGGGEYAARTDRVEVRRAFTGIANASLIHGVFVAIDLRGWDEFADEIATLRPSAKDPFYVPFQMFLEGVCAEIKCFAPSERIALVFDDRPESGKVIALYNSLKADPDPAFRVVAARLGAAASGTSHNYPGLQAADLLAYEARLYVSGPIWGIRGSERRPPWRQLASKLRHGRVITRERMPELVAAMRQKGGDAARLRLEALEEKRVARVARGAAARARTSPVAPQAPPPEPPGGPS